MNSATTSISLIGLALHVISNADALSFPGRVRPHKSIIADLNRSRAEVCEDVQGGEGEDCSCDPSLTVIWLSGSKPVAFQPETIFPDTSALSRARMYIFVYSTRCIRPESSREAASVSAATARFKGEKAVTSRGCSM